MKNEIHSSVSPQAGAFINPAPSLRVPVTMKFTWALPAVVVALAAALVCLWPCPSQGETVLERKVHIEPGIAEVPNVPTLCEVLKMAGRRVTAGGCQLYCEVEGRGTALVLVHGGPGATHQGFHPFFRKAASFSKVVYYDQRGCGQSDFARGGGYTIEQAVADLDDLREALKLEKWVVLGWSYGGVVAQAYLLKYPERVAGLVLVGAAPDAFGLSLQPGRQSEFISAEEQRKMQELHEDPALSGPRLTYNAWLNGDWKRQNYYKPTREAMARTALYDWNHDPLFRQDILRDLDQADFRGLFEGCPIPVLMAEGKYDLTWGADKAEKLSACFDGCQLVMFERSAHAPFADEPDKFFTALRAFMEGLPDKPVEAAHWQAQVAARQAQVAARQAERAKLPEHMLKTAGWGRKSSEKIAGSYSEAWLKQVSDPMLLMRLGFALYDAKEYEKALAVFRRLEETDEAGVALVWQGQMLDLLGRRAEALAAYRKAAGQSLYMRHGQYGIVVSREYVQTRMKTPFQRVENQVSD
jgi:proline iminopeptidase